jgi:hypothetical protein
VESKLRYSDAILENRAYAAYETVPMIDLRHGGQFGPMTDVGGYVSSSAYIQKPLVAVLLAAPLGFNDLDNPDVYIRTLKALVELQGKSISGLNATLTAEFQSNPFGGAGEVQEDISNVTRAASTPTWVWTERQGKPVRALLSNWMTGIMMDPITKYPTVISNGRSGPTDMLPDYTGMTVLFYEPDPVHKKVVEAWLCTNMMPKSGGEITGERDLTAGGQGKDYTIEFTAITQHGYGPKRLAQTILDRYNLAGMNPNLQQPFITDITADVKAADKGYAETLTTVSRTKISR